MRIIGLTGAAGAGKNEIAKILQKKGACVIDADYMAHELYDFQTPLWRELVKAFGSKILLRGGKISRKKLGEIVFSEQQKLKELNHLVHPHLKQAIIKKIKEAPLDCSLVIVNAALLKEIGLLDEVDEVWVAAASEKIRLKRLMKKGRSRTEAMKIIRSQAKQKEYLAMADVVIKNEGTRKQLEARVKEILREKKRHNNGG